MDSPQSSMTIDPLLHYSGLQVDGISMMTSIGGHQKMVIDNDGPEINDNDKPVIEPHMKKSKASKDKAEQSQQSPPPKWIGTPDCPRISTPTCAFSLNVPQVERFVLDTQPPTGTILPCTMVDPDNTNTTEDHIPKPRTRSVARATRFTIPDSLPLSESDEDEVGVDSRKVCVIPLPYRAYKPSFVKQIDSSEPINLDLQAPANQEHLATYSQVQNSPSPSSWFAPGESGVRVKRNKRLNRIAKASPAV
jgi:hypothetical protein